MNTNYLDFEQPIAELEVRIEELRLVGSDNDLNIADEISKLETKSGELTKSIFSDLGAWQVAQLARHPQRPYTLDYINGIFDDFDDYMNDPELTVPGPAHRPAPINHIDMNDNGGRFNVDRSPNPYLFFNSYLKTLSREEKVNLYNNLYFQSNIKRGVAPPEDTLHIMNSRYFIPKFTVEGELVPAGKKRRTVKKRDKKNKISKKKPKKIKRKRRSLKRKS